MKIVRIADLTTGHGCFPPQNTIQGSFNVFVNGIGVHRIGDAINPHCCGLVCHPGFAATGSKTVFANGVPITRVGDMANCGSILATGSLNVNCSDIVESYTFPKVDESYFANGARLVEITGESALYDDKESVHLNRGHVTRDNPTPLQTDDTTNESAIKDVKSGENFNILLKAMKDAGIVNVNEKAMFLAQLHHESGGFIRLRELNYSADNVWNQRGSQLSTYGITLEILRQEYKRSKESMFEYLYADKYRTAKLGNVKDGDGIAYKGRGFIQITGRFNYTKYGYQDTASQVELPEIAAQVAIKFWFDNRCRVPAQNADVAAVTRIINGGLNGLAERKALFNKYLADAKNNLLEYPMTASPTQKIITPSKETKTDANFQLSENYKLKDLTTGTLFPHALKAQHGFTESQLVYNMKGLAVNILEPLRKLYPNFRINSAFRSFTGSKSQHERGMAVDIQWPNISNAEYFERAKKLKDLLIFDQMIFEHGNSIWIHFSFDINKNAQRRQVLTMYKNDYTSGLTLYYK